MVLFVAATGCTIDVTPTTAPETAPVTAPVTAAPSTTTIATTTIADSTTTTAATEAACIIGDVPFATEGVIGSFGDDTGDASAIAGFRWSVEEQCERFVIDLATAGGSPAATLGATAATLRLPSGLIRVALPPEVQTTSIADTIVDTSLVTRAYVVRLADGGLAVDLHLEAPTGVRARAFAVGSPARVVIDLRPASADPPVDPPRTAPGVVLLGPPAGPAEYPLRVTGYARPVQGRLVAVLAPGTADRIELPIEPAGGIETWGEFTATFQTGPVGTTELLVGDPAAEIGGADALRIPLDLR